MMSQDEGNTSFLSRWSRRKAQMQRAETAAPDMASADADQKTSVMVRENVIAQGQPATLGASIGAAASRATGAPSSLEAMSPAAGTDGQTTEALKAEVPQRLTLQDVEQLDAQSDYRSFVARDVDPNVRNAAFKKLFHSNPHFNVMDGLDVYIDDYNTPNPLPVAIMKTLVQARAMGLIDDELKEQEPPQDSEPLVEEPDSGEAPNGDPASVVAPQGPEGLELNELSMETAAADDGDAARGSGQPAIVELVMVPDTASNDEPIKPLSSAVIASGTVVPFPRRPNSADPT